MENKKEKFKFKVGDRVKVKKDLIVGEAYGMNNSDIEEIFTKRMNEFRGNEATILDVINGKYILDIDCIHAYTDEMLNRFIDTRSTSDYKENEEIESLLSHIKEKQKKQREKIEDEKLKELIDKALDEKDYRRFMELTDKYKK